ncbi:hypothetical protein EDL98_08255 [Ornithobacterium rhinotracheale]|uniref:immunity 49 family protein n=1 Tax=Ornithobacterium rhinotracheale TaxID=28251 RepID=UPI00129C6694|nr:immunity 49 family protein [Ornithobacterium rhinotracheale]MRJ11070.1 hypothetical protein [Ornithobacterium rhinotracheale]
MLTLKEIVEIEKEQELIIIKKFIDSDKEHLCRSLSSKNVLFGINSLAEDRIIEAKQFFFNVSLLDVYIVLNFNDRFLDYGIPKVTFTLLSDNWKYLQNIYSKLRYNSFYIDDKTNKEIPITMDEMVLQGESAIWCNTVQFFMANDIQGVERNLNIIETLTLPKLPKNQQELKIDYEFYKALLAKDKAKCEALLEQLVSPKIHKKRNVNDIHAQYVSFPALGYAKLAWRQGVEVEVKSSLIPKEILPIAPLDNYKIPYDFLKDEVK